MKLKELPTEISSTEKLPVQIFATAVAACKKSAEKIAILIREKKEKGENVVLSLATGSTPKLVYKELIRLHKEEGLCFQHVIAFSLDEYFGLSANDSQSYHYFMQEIFFKHINIKPQNCYMPDSSIPIKQLKAHCEAYEKKIAKAGGIDLQLLGIGSNGHIGFNEPGSNINSVTLLITLDHSTRFDAIYDFGELISVPKKAITMGINTILKANEVLLLALGEKKAEIIKKTIEGPQTEMIPATYLQGHNNISVILDEPAASSLISRKFPWLSETVDWDSKMIKKAVTSLSLSLNKPILKLTNNDYN